jgi:DNA-binding Lrp family transcriptional regulator
MDSLDIRLLRSLFRGERLTLHGTDPRCSVLELARKTHASRVTVSRRLTRWRTEGFWNGEVAYPNPDALGLKFQMQAIALENGRDRPRIERALRDVLQPFMSYQVENMYAPLLLSESPKETARRQQSFARASGARIVYPPFDVPFGSSSLTLRPRDWRILQALRRTTEPDWAKAAREVGMTSRGLQRRVGQLMDANALFFHPLLDFRKLAVSIAWVGLLHDGGADAETLWARVTELNKDLFPVEPFFPLESMIPAVDRPPAAGTVVFFTALPSGSSSDQIRRDFGSLPGVLDALILFPTQNTSVPERLDKLISERVEPRQRRPAGGTTS